jgi:hypothetical protein
VRAAEGLRDFTDFPRYLKREANRRRAADSGRIVGKQEVIRANW